MVNSLNQASEGIEVHRSNASKMIELLKNDDSINDQLKIIRKDEFVIIPIKKNFNQTRISTEIQFKLVHSEFPEKNLKPRSIQEYLRKILPANIHSDLPSAFEQIGDIAVIDIKDEMIPFTGAIADAILLVHSSVKRVYRKSSKVDGVLRLRGLILIGGKENTTTIHIEYNLKICVDISKVYFSPRLSTEHRRIAEMVQEDEAVLDMFGGAAPFALHIAQLKKCNITSIDINPHAEELIKKSIKLNHHLKGNIAIMTGDVEKIGLEMKSQNKLFDRIIMNHPSKAVEYLPIADNLVKTGGFIYLYIFAPFDTLESSCIEAVNAFLPNADITDIHQVRQSSPSEWHVCITIRKA
ncbi:MAG: class I SAM-dependent methyltransferase [Candidatus Kariarchaeaceae archaeon]|jgi:tRNA (guanine37-N1)-methyltransferase